MKVFNARKKCNSNRFPEARSYPVIADPAQHSGTAPLPQTADPYPVLVLNSDGQLLEFNRAAACCYELDKVSSLFDLPYDSTTKNWVVSQGGTGQTGAALQAKRQDTQLLVSLFVYATTSNRLTLKTTELNWPRAVLNLLETTFGLTPAEIAITQLLVAGMAVRQVAQVRCTSVATVRTQIRNILHKSQCHGLSELTRMVLCASTLPDLTTRTHPKNEPMKSRIDFRRVK